MGLWCGLSELGGNIEAGIDLAVGRCSRLDVCGLVGVGWASCRQSMVGEAVEGDGSGFVPGDGVVPVVALCNMLRGIPPTTPTPSTSHQGARRLFCGEALGWVGCHGQQVAGARQK